MKLPLVLLRIFEYCCIKQNKCEERWKRVDLCGIVVDGSAVSDETKIVKKNNENTRVISADRNLHNAYSDVDGRHGGI